MRFAEIDLPLFSDIPAAELVHIVMPNMAYACGGSMLTDAGRFVIGWDRWESVTCDGCKAPGFDALAEDGRRQQRQQAAA